jgi:hypothetical protein
MLTELPQALRETVERRLADPGFKDHEGLADSLREQGYEIPTSSLRRLGMRLRKLKGPPQLTDSRTRSKPQGRASRPGVTTEALIQLAQDKLCSALADIDQLKQGDMSRLVHAVARLTQAAVSLQRWNDKFNQRADESGRASARKKARRGLSPETSQALRNALLGIAPFGLEQAAPQRASDEGSEASASPPESVTGQSDDRRHRVAPTPIKDRSVRDDEDAR